MEANEELENVPEQHQLVDAVRKGDLEQCQTIVKHLKDQTFSSSLRTNHLIPALAAATSSKQTHIIRFLLDQGCSVSDTNMVLALGDDTEVSIAVFQTFLDYGWGINSKTDSGSVMLRYAVFLNPPYIDKIVGKRVTLTLSAISTP